MLAARIAHALDLFKHAERYLGEVMHRFNRQFRLQALLPPCSRSQSVGGRDSNVNCSTSVCLLAEIEC